VPIDAKATIHTVPGPLVILNPRAGGGRAGRLAPWLSAALGSMPSGELAETTGPGHAVELARGAAADGRDRVVAVGGDGTVNEIVEGLMAAERRPTLGIVPQGSGNDLARSLGLPRRRDAAWAVAVGTGTRSIDVGLARSEDRSRHFAAAGGIGFDAQVAAVMGRQGRWQRGALGYLLTTLDELRRFRSRPIRLTLDDETPIEMSVLLVAIANGAYYGGGMRIAPDAVVDDGRLDLCVVGNISRRTALRQLPNLYRGTHVRHPAVSLHRARRIRIDGDPDTLVHLDGESFGRLPLDVQVVPRALRVACGPQRDRVR
jgi:diacylglycerol kinase (ATP)